MKEDQFWFQFLFLILLYQITGDMVDMQILERMGLEDIKDRLVDLIIKFRELKLDANEFTCLKFLILLNPGN